MKIYRACVQGYDYFDDIICYSRLTAEQAICQLFFKHYKYNYMLNSKLINQDSNMLIFTNKINNLVINKNYTEAAELIFKAHTYFIGIDYEYGIQELDVVEDIVDTTIDPSLFDKKLKEIIFK